MFHLAQFNIAQAKSSMDNALMEEFANNLARINALADSSNDFIWRLQDGSGDATSLQLFDDPNLLVNISVWKSIDSLRNFVYKSRHGDFFKRRAAWFNKMENTSLVL